MASGVIGQPKYNFILGHTNSETIPIEGLIEATAAAMRKDGPGLAINLHNGGLLGYLPLREFLVQKLSRHRGVDVTVDDILITSGSQTAAVLINTALLEPGDTVVAESFSYVGMLGDLRGRAESTSWVCRWTKKGCGWTPLPTPGGTSGKGRTAQVPVYHSDGTEPHGRYHAHREAAGDATAQRRVRRSDLEDDCYADLVYEGESVDAIRSLDDSDRVIHMGSFSKNLAPGMRLGYVVASWQLLGQLLPLKGDIGLLPSGRWLRRSSSTTTTRSTWRPFAPPCGRNGTR